MTMEAKRETDSKGIKEVVLTEPSDELAMCGKEEKVSRITEIFE